MVTQIICTSASQEQIFPQKTATASRLGSKERKNLSLQVLAQTETVCRLAQNHGVSRKFLYQQAAKASDAIDEAFTPSTDDDKVLFYLPVTKNWIRQFVLALILICHSSFRGVIEILKASFADGLVVANEMPKRIRRQLRRLTLADCPCCHAGYSR